uniref:Acyl-CoA dehydrogenase family member 9, mitochondrial n=1 Tax=Aceria tosichella TaxID=561515 RepID=A0A6G1S5M9_9ACAR
MLRIFTIFSHRPMPARLLSSTTHNLNATGQIEKVDLKPGEVKEEEISLSKFQSTELLPEVPIKSLDLVKRIDKVEKKGSFTVDIFKGSYDEEFLIYPDTLDNRQENQQLKDQAAMVKQLYPQIWDDERQLQKFNFFNLFQLSVSEMMTIFESIGASTRACTETTMAKTEAEDLQHTPKQTQISKAVISLIIRNCLTYWPMFKSKSTKVRSLVPQKHILFGGSSDDTTLCKPIGFCWSEQAPELGSLPPQEWFTLGTHGGPTNDHTLIQGRKTRILHEDSVEHYLVYFRDKFLSDKYLTDVPENEANPASDPFVGCCLVHKSQLKINPPYYDSAGCKYVDIDIDTIVPGDQIVFPAERKDPTGVNIKALGQLATSSVIMGILKDTLRMTYQHLLSTKRGLLDCDIIERKLTGVTSRIFAIESMVYYIAGMYDGLKDGFDAHMESTVLKVIANEYAYASLKDLQDICSSDMFIISKIQDQINMFDSFLDGNIYNRLYLATMGVIWFARSKNMHLNQLRLAPWYPGYYFKTMMRERAQRGDYLTLNADIYGHLHPSLKEAGIQLEYIIKRVKYAAESLCIRYGKDVTGAQSALYKLSQLSIDAFMLTTMCARASKSYCNGSRNSEIDVHITTSFAHQLAREVRIYMETIDMMPINALENRAKLINELNIRQGGYYAESPLDPNI